VDVKQQSLILILIILYYDHTYQDYSHVVIFEPLSSFELHSFDAQSIKLHCLGCYSLSLFTMATWTELCYKADTNISILNMLHVSRDRMSQVAVDLQCLTWLWNSSVLHGCGIPVSHMVVELQCLIWLWNFSVSYGCEIPVSHMVVEFQCLICISRNDITFANLHI
jgi:hypothetical protein